MSAEPTTLFERRPRLRPEILLSEPLLRGPATVHLIRDPVVGSAFEVGPKEHFLISRLDGERSLGEIGGEYAREFGKRLGEANWNRLLGLLGGRGLLVGSPRREVVAAPSTPARVGGLYRGSLRLVADADATTERLRRLLSPLLRPVVLLPSLALGLALQVALVVGIETVLRDTWWLLRHPVPLMAVFSLLWTSTVAHELAHGIAARRYGAAVSEIGLRWRLPFATMYCRVGDYRFLPRRRHQLTIAAAGALANLLFLLPFGLWWAVLEPADPTRRTLSGLLLLGGVQALVNLVPLPPLDGYTMLAHLLRAADLAADSGRYLRLRTRDRPAAARYPRRARTIYTAYGIGSSVLVCLLVAAPVTAAYALFAP
ncbi:peptidase M50 [Streptomyces sp. WMMC905]|uniref:peptidase M50 n=1 Tax=Streptomyces sp. WMMC905 TaxID=3404123 RepID=UPI003B94305E